LNSAYGSLHTMGALLARNQDVGFYEGFVGMQNSLHPHGDPGRFVEELPHLDLSAEAIGKNVHIAYGDPDATLAQIRIEGNGGHVGDASEIMHRALSLFVWAGQRWPDLPLERGGRIDSRQNQQKTIYTEALDSRFNFLISLPPGYFEEQNSEVRYPVLYFLHGHGQEPVGGLGPAMVVLHQFMNQGLLPKIITVMPDGRCCYRDSETGLRECSCAKSNTPGMRSCVDPECRGPHETCAIRDIPSDRLTRECINAAFFQNAITDRYGRTDQIHVMRYGDALLDLIHWVDDNYRTKHEALHPSLD